MSSKFPEVQVRDIPKSIHIGIVAARFNGHIVDLLLDDCCKRLEELDIDSSRIETHRVPGAFELPMVAKILARTKRFGAIICLGCVVRGDTPHFDYVAGECARGIQKVAIEESLPVIFGVLTTNTEEQALARTRGPHSHNGQHAAEAALEMIAVMRRIQSS